MLAFLTTLWWLLFWTAVGLCIGSFLNAVIYRLPRRRSLRNPLWSSCPACRHPIRWHDNLPVISFILLRGRCRHCGVPISTRYVVVETVMALVVLMLLDAFFIGRVRPGLSTSAFDLTDRLAHDWPVFVAHVLLFACLLPMAAIDLEHYWVDVRFTNLAAVGGFVLHALWTPEHSTDWIRPSSTTAVMAVFALAGLGIVWIVRICQPYPEPEENQEPEAQSPWPRHERHTTRRPPPSLASPSRAGGWITSLALVGLAAALLLDEGTGLHLRHTGRALLPLVVLFGLIAWESAVERPSDQQIVDAIHDDRPFARAMVLRELALLLPALVAAAAGWWLMARGGNVSSAIRKVLEEGIPLGLATAASGYIIAGALGWAVRIGFTLLFGKEAFGSGDIHLMAAAGCVAGWPVAVLGFFLTCGLALMGWVAALPFKRSRALPLGPWLSLSFLAVVVFYHPITHWTVIKRAGEAARLLFLENSQPSMLERLP